MKAMRQVKSDAKVAITSSEKWVIDGRVYFHSDYHERNGMMDEEGCDRVR